MQHDNVIRLVTGLLCAEVEHNIWMSQLGADPRKKLKVRQQLSPT